MRLAAVVVCVAAVLLEAGPLTEIQIRGNGTTGPYSVGRTHLFAGTDEVWHEGHRLSPGIDYQIDYLSGVLVLSRPLPIGDSLRVLFAAYPGSLRPTYYRLRPQQLTDDTILAVPPPVGGSKTPVPPGLLIIGSKSLIVNVGNRGEPTLSQSLDLQISGELTPEMQVEASISDRNLSPQMGGTTALDELDKMRVRLQGPGLRMELGDLDLVGVPNSLLDFRRNLTGLNTKVEPGDWRASGAAAFSSAQQQEVFFFGVDGKQGPYFLVAARAITSPPAYGNIIPGTEEVYLDGRRLTRGGEADYTIDYDDGSIVFSPRHLITSNSRITVKYQIAASNYRSAFYHVALFRQGWLTLGGQYLREADDKTAPRNFEIGHLQRTVLSSAGEFADSAFTSGARFVGPGQGDYLLQVDSLGDTIFVYVGAQAGDYEVTFTRVGEGRGSYQFAGQGHFVYVGVGQGAFLPRIYYPLPQSRDYFSLIARKDGPVHFNSEVAVARADLNSYSNRDQLRQGVGVSFDGGLKAEELHLGGRTVGGQILGVRFRHLGSEFVFPGLIDSLEFARQYAMPAGQKQGAQNLFESAIQLQSSAGDAFEVGAGFLRQAEIASNRGRVRLRVALPGSLVWFGGIELAHSDSAGEVRKRKWDRYESGLAYKHSGWEPGMIWRREQRSGMFAGQYGISADEFEAYALWKALRSLAASSRFISREQHLVATPGQSSQREFDQYQIRQDLRWGNASTGLSSELVVARLYQKRYWPVNDRLDRYLTSFKAGYGSPNLSVTLFESVGGSAGAAKVREFIYVGPGKGDHRKDGEDFVPEPGGEYLQVIRNPGLDEPLSSAVGYRIDGGLRIRFDALTRSGGVNWEADVTHETNLVPAAALRWSYLLPARRFDAAAMSFSRYDAKQRTTYYFDRHGRYARYVLGVSAVRGSEYAFEKQESKTSTHRLEFGLPLTGRINWVADGELAYDNRIIASGRANIRRQAVGSKMEYQTRFGLRLELPFQYVHERESTRELDIDTYWPKLRAVFTAGQIARLEGQAGYAYVKPSKKNVVLPYVMAMGNKPNGNIEVSLGGRLRLNAYSSAEVRYSYRRLGDGYANYNLRVEAKAEF